MTNFTRDFLGNLKSNLSSGFIPQLPDLKKDLNNYDDHWFQLLLFSKSDSSDKFKAQLVYGSKGLLKSTYFGTNDLLLPTSGVEVNKQFVKPRETEYPTVRFLLQCRKLSQVLTSTWLAKDIEKADPTKKKIQTKRKLIRQILDTYNIRPEICILSNDSKPNKPECLALKPDSDELKKKLLEIEAEVNEDSGISEADLYKLSYYLIKFRSISFESISLALLLCGQAYYEQEDGTWEQICEPIYSTYESIWEQAVKISWDTFYATRRDISQAGILPNPPYTEVTMGYPSKPNEFSLQDAQIEQWVTAKELSKDEKLYPFYPEKNENEGDNTKWESKQLEYIIPAVPYIPLSCF